MGHQSLAERCLISLVQAPADLTTTSSEEITYRVDMLGWDNVLFICIVGALTDAPTFQVVESTVVTSGSITAITAAVSAAVADTTGDESLVLIDVKRDSITKRYVGMTVDFDADGSSASIWSVVAIRYNGNGITYPVTQVAADANGSGYKTIELIKA